MYDPFEIVVSHFQLDYFQNKPLLFVSYGWLQKPQNSVMFPGWFAGSSFLMLMKKRHSISLI